MLKQIGLQFRKPAGLAGKIITRLMIKGNTPEYDILIPELDIAPGDKILEIGYGHGVGVDRIASEYPCTVTGIDFSELSYRTASKRNRMHIANHTVALFYGDFLLADNLPGPFNRIFHLNVIYFWDQLDKPFAKIFKLLTDGGLLCFYMAGSEFLESNKMTRNRVFNKYPIDYVVEQLTLAGFRDISYHFHKGYYIKCRK